MLWLDFEQGSCDIKEVKLLGDIEISYSKLEIVCSCLKSTQPMWNNLCRVNFCHCNWVGMRLHHIVLITLRFIISMGVNQFDLYDLLNNSIVGGIKPAQNSNWAIFKPRTEIHLCLKSCHNMYKKVYPRRQQSRGSNSNAGKMYQTWSNEHAIVVTLDKPNW